MKNALKNFDGVIAGAMMIVTILLVIVNVITRKLFNYIIIWSEEIATSCFVYSVFIGAAYAYRKHQHVGVDLLVERLPAGARRVVHLITNALLVIINGYITVLSVQFIQSSWIKRMPITKLPSSAVSTALIIGFGLFTRLFRQRPQAQRQPRRGGGRMSTFLSILPIIIALVLYFTGIPIAYALFAAALTYFGFIDTTTVPCLLMQKFITSTQSFPFLAIPFFIMCGSIMNYGGISARLMDFADALTGHLPGGLAQINVLLSMLMGGCSGSANADAAMECKLLVPEMEKRGYGKGFSAAITAASSCVTPIIPPGINLIVYGLIAGASVGQLFAAGYIPGLLMAVMLMIAVAIISKKRGYAPSRPRRATLGEIGRQALKSFWALFFPLGIIMGMRFGIFTPTEAGGVGVLYCLIVGKFVYKGLKKEHFIPILRETISGTATVMLIIVSATVFGYYLNWENIPTMLLNAVTSFASNKFLVLLVMNVVLLIVGMFLEGGAALIILAPLMVPIVKAAGIDLVHFGIVCNVNIMIGGLTPPFGSMMFTCVSITGCKMQEFIKECVPFIIALLIALLLLTYIPGISMLIPNLIY